ncbi:hypothetical protein JJB52_08730 [Clostridium perfringens]|uniref:hypothetical protein n=1 Tax=Clostridium perfringens TaxID=1502 RepID=UPI001ABA980B|nr:hypothetical protein [Clostridium perfringens]MBO3344350.1 hypothetical protein [Clostridium perfringens]MBO3347035.1 hypothetical protein [Clostridium perfringens]MBO3350091.1 hypothetical protein [Clostridium perfringens]MBO3370741.1 hypothetical protein [Clostridium perfringens]
MSDKKTQNNVEIDYSKLRRSKAKTKHPVYFAVSEEEMEERMARAWERIQVEKAEKELMKKCNSI